jgi:Zinc finger, C3HC4 type (RING finger)
MNRRASAFDARSMMEDRSKVAAAAASVIPFSCIICFDEFDSQERPPMILPCGHTYVCLPCTKRLKRCMECRQPLFLPAPIPAAAAAHQQHHAVTKAPHPPHLPPHGTTHYYHHHQQQQQQPYYQLTQQQRLAQRYGTPALPDVAPLTPPQWALANSHNQRIPLPIPKNLVLLSMMEAAERQARINNELSLALREEENSDDDDDGESNDDDDDEEDEEAFDLNKIITGMATLSGPCGTYAVREKGGLVVVRADPRRRRNDSNNDNKKNDDPTTTTIILERKSSKESSESTTPEEGETDEKKEEDGDVVAATATAAAEEEQELLLLVQEGPQSPIPLEYGQTVQVVAFEDGVAKLARSKGYVLGNSSQLVKGTCFCFLSRHVLKIDVFLSIHSL